MSVEIPLAIQNSKKIPLSSSLRSKHTKRNFECALNDLGNNLLNVILLSLDQQCAGQIKALNFCLIKVNTFNFTNIKLAIFDLTL
jgi:hypothetical protein